MFRKRLIASVVLASVLSFGVPALADGYRTTVGSGDDEIPLVVVKGTPYEMGHAFGALMKEEARSLLTTFLSRAREGEPEVYSDENLDAAWRTMAPHINPRFVDELKGLADSAGVSEDLVRRVHMIPAISAYACSGAALWGEATREDVLYQFRNLDYIMEGGLQEYPAVVIYLPDEGIAHVNPTFAGYIGSNTGMNAEGITLTEMGYSPEREYPYDLDGIHFAILFRDILYEAESLDDAVNMIERAKRIKKYRYIVGDGKNRRAVKMRAFAPRLDIWQDNDPKDEVAPNVKDGLVYNCENRDPVGWAHIQRYYGGYDAALVIQLAKSVGGGTGNLLGVVYDATNLELWAAYAQGQECAYRRTSVHIDMNDYLDFARRPPGAVVIEGN